MVVILPNFIGLAIIASMIWVFIDAPKHGMSWTWGLGCLLLWIVFFPWYLAKRAKKGASATWGWVLFILVLVVVIIQIALLASSAQY